MRTELTKADIEKLFVGALDGALADKDEAQLKSGLDESPELKLKFEKYENAVKLLRGAPKEKAPDALASMILRRVRRRRLFGSRNLHLAHMQYRVPAEVLVPILLGVAVAAFLIFAAP